MTEDFVYIFVHIPKTAGTTFIKHVEKNFGKNEVVNLHPITRKVLNAGGDYEDCLKVVKKHFSHFSSSQKRSVKIIYGHTAFLGVEKLVGKKARYFTFFRNPEERTKSFYNYYMTMYKNDSASGKIKNFYKWTFLVKDKAPSFYLWVKEKYGVFTTRTVDGLFRTLGFPVYNIEKLLDKFYFIGTDKTYEEDAAFLYGILGVKKFFIDQNISRKYIKKLTKKEKDLVDKKNKKDYMIYEGALKRNLEFKKNNRDFKEISKRVLKTKKRLEYFTQVIFDFKESLHRLSAFIRTKSKTYSSFVDFLKGINR